MTVRRLCTAGWFGCLSTALLLSCVEPGSRGLASYTLGVVLRLVVALCCCALWWGVCCARRGHHLSAAHADAVYGTESSYVTGVGTRLCIIFEAGRKYAWCASTCAWEAGICDVQGHRQYWVMLGDACCRFKEGLYLLHAWYAAEAGSRSNKEQA